MADKISEIYAKARKKGVLTNGLTEDMFREQTKTDEGLRSFYDIATANGMKFHPFEEFKGRFYGTSMPNDAKEQDNTQSAATSLADNAITAAKEPVAKPVDIPTEVNNPNLLTPIEAERAGQDNLHNQINKSWGTQIFEKPTTDMEAAMTMAGEQKTPEYLLKTFAQAWSEHSDEGKAMLKNMEDVYNDTQNAYLQQFQQTQEYANLVSKLQKEVKAKELTPEQAGEELSKLFIAQYGNKLETDRQNLYSEYLKEAQAALEQSPYQKDWNRVNAHIATDQNKDLNSRINAELEKRTNEIKQQKQSAPQSPLKLARDIMADRKGDVEVAKATKDLQAAKAFATQAENMITSVRESKNFFADFGKSFGKTITSSDTWDFGVGQLMNSIALKNAADKADKGEPLTHDEELLLEAAANYMAVSMYYSDKVGRGTKAGQTTAASIPFMLEFMLTSGVGAAMTNATTRGITRFAIRMLGNGARKKGVRIGAEVAGKTLSDIGYAELLTNTLSAPRIAEGTISRMNGSVKPQLNDAKDGFQYDGRTGQQGLGEALWNAHSDQFIENYSEVFFGGFDPLKEPAKAAIRSSKVLGKMAAGVESNAVTGTLIRAWNNPTAVALRKETRFGGLFEETMEEEVGGLFRLVANTDVNNAKDAGLDIDSQIDIVLGLAPSVLLMNGAGATFHYSKQARDVRKMREYLKTDEERRMFDRVMSESRSGEFGREAHDFIREIVMNNDIPNEAKRQIILQTVDKYKDVLSNDLVKQAQQIERQDRASRRETAIRERIGLQTNESDGKVYRVSITGNDIEDNFIKKGNIVINEDGTIDKSQSDGYFVVAITDKDGNTQIKQVPVSAITNVEGGESAEDIAQTEIEYYNTLDQAHEMFPEGSIVTIPNSNGAVSEVHYDEQGNILVDVEGGQQVKFTPKEAIDKLVPVHEETPQQPEVEGTPTPQPAPIHQEENPEPTQREIVTFNIAGADVPFEKVGDQYYMLDADNKRTGRPFSLQDLQEKGAEPINTETLPQSEQIDITNPQPIGTNKFGNVYQWVVGKAKEAAQFLRQHKNSYLKGVFHRDDIGDIDLVWGNDKAGLQHIVKRHILEQTDFDSISEAIEAIEETIKTGSVEDNGKGRIAIDNGKYRVILAQDKNGNWVVTAYDNSRPMEDKQKNGTPAPNPSTTEQENLSATGLSQQAGDTNNALSTTPQVLPSKEQDNLSGVGVSHQSGTQSESKGTENNSTPQENNKEKVNKNGLHGRIVPFTMQVGDDIVCFGLGENGAITPFVLRDGLLYHRINDIEADGGYTAEELKALDFRPLNEEDTNTFNSLLQEEQNNNVPDVAEDNAQAARDGILRILDNYGTLDAFFTSETGAKDIVRSLLDNGIITQQEVAGLTENTDRGFVLSPAGKDYVTDLLIGGLFDEQTIRMLGNDKGLKQSILRAMPSIIENRRLGGYALTDNINGAIRLLYEARQAGVAYPLYIRQVDAFEGKVSDRFTPFEMLLAEEMSSGVENFRQVLNLYNNSARDDANGQTGLFEPRTIEDIKNEILQHYANRKQPTAAAEPATRPANPQTQSPLPSTPTGARQGQDATDIPASNILEQIEAEAEPFEEIELTPENWYALFGEDGIISTPIGYVKMGEHQYLKLAQKGRDGKLGMIKPTLEHPSVVVMDKSQAKDGQTTEREFSYVFVKAFVGQNGERLYYFTSITVSKDGQEVVVSNQEKTANRIAKLIQQGKLVWLNNSSLHPTTQVEESVPLNRSRKPTQTDNQPTVLGINPSGISADKGTKNIPNPQTSEQKSAENLPNASQNEQTSSDNSRSDNRRTNSEGTPKDEQSKNQRLEQERRERILREGTGFDKAFGLVAPKDITAPQQITDNIEAIVRGLALAEKALGEKGNTNTADITHPLSNYNGWVYGEGHIANAKHQIEGYLQALDVLDPAILKEWQKQLNIKTYGDLRNYVEKIYNETKAAQTAQLEAYLGKPLSLDDKKALIKQISDGKTKVVLVTNKNIVKKLAELGATRKTIADVAAALSRGEKVKGFFAKGMVILNTDALQTGNDIIATYVHERQHLLTAANPQLLSALTDNATADELAQILRTISGTTFYDQYNNGTTHGHTALADELISHVMQEAYATGKDAAEVAQNYGINNETILQTLNNIDYEQRQSNSLSKARRDNILGRNTQSSSRQSGRNNQTQSQGGLVQQGSRPAGKGSSGTPSRGQTAEREKIANTPVSALSFDEQAKALKELISFLSKKEEEYFDSILPNLKADKLGVNAVPIEVILQEYSIIERLEERVLDYVAEHYPTQANISALTDSPQGKQEREAMRKDPALAQLRKEVSEQQDAATRKINDKYKEVRAITDNPSITLGQVAQLWNDALEFCRSLDAENGIRFSVGNAGGNLHKSLKGSTFAGGKSRVPKAELAAAYADMFRKQAQGQFPDGNGIAYSANYLHKFSNGRITNSIRIDGNEEKIKQLTKEYGTDSASKTSDTRVKNIWGTQRPSSRNDALFGRKRGGDERIDRLHGAEQSDGSPDNQKVHRDTQSGSQTGVTDPRFSVSGTQVVPLGERTLVGLHNITSDKLRKVLKAGGLANPSAAVIDIAKQDHHGYGEISLVMPSSLVDSNSGNNAGTYTGDMWSPTYPTTERRMSDKGADAYYKALNNAFGNDPARIGLRNKIELGFSNWLSGQHDPKDFAYWYMLEKGITPEDVLYNSGVPASVKQRFAPIAGKRLYEYSEEDKALLLSLIAEQRGITVEELKQEAQELRQRYQETLDDPDSKVFQKRIAQEAIEDIDTYGVKYNVLEKGMDDLQNAIRYDGKIDVDATLAKAAEQVQADYKDDFDKWLSDFDERFGIKEYIFDGYTRNGDRKYIPDTLANASRLMNREELQNAGSHGGFNATKGQLIERMNTLADIRANKYRLTSKEGEKDEQWEQLSNEWFDNIIDPLSKMQNISDNPFSNGDYAEQRLLEALRQKDPIVHLNKEYGYNIAKDSAFAKSLNDLVQRIKDLPAKYFETKFKRPVYLNEFRNAVVPNTLPQDLRDGLEQAGLGLYEYDPQTEGSRREATQQATEDDGIRFSVSTTLETDKTLTPEARKEMQAIAEQAKADGTFMQAPNGKPSNLNERQWLQVRTRAFKNWFGDWEKSARIEKLRNSEPVIITGSEFDITDNPKKAAIEYGKKLQGYYTNKDTGVVIQLQRGRRNGGINEVLQHNYKDIPHIQSVAAIPQIIEKSIFIDSEPNNAVEKNPSVVSYDHYVCGLRIGDADYTVHALIAMDSKGNRYYDHNLVQIEKKKLLDEIQQATSIGDFGTTPDTKSTISNSDRKVTKLYSILQTNSSKCVDANGEPLVVYHGTPNEFTIFNGTYSSGMFMFTDVVTLAETFANKNIRNGGRTIVSFLNVRNPKAFEMDRYDWAGRGVGDNEGNSINKGRKHNFTYAESVRAKREHYDGVVLHNVSDNNIVSNHYIAFSPNQIKSATDNNGSFGENSDDIRFSVIGERGAANLDHAEEVTTRMDNLQVARDMEKDGKDTKTIRLATGWERGADKKWRYEIPDAKVKDTLELGGGQIVKRFDGDMLWNEGRLEDTIVAPELFSAYPQLKKVRLSTDTLIGDMPSNGSHSPKTNTITIHASKLKYLNSILNHEIQHAIQHIEGFERGGDYDKLGGEYFRLAGEVEARNAQSRMRLSEQQRRERLLAETEDVAREDQIFLLGDEAESAEAQYSELDYDTDNLTDAQQLATDTVLSALNDAGISIKRVSEEQAEREVSAQKKSLDDTATWSELMVRANKAADITSNDNAKVQKNLEIAKRKLETATWREDDLHTKNAADVSSLDDAKVQQKIDISKRKLENQSTKSIKNPVSFISDVLELRQTGSSYYGTFKLQDGSFITLRLSNHNATVSNFDNEGETEGVSIVISAHPSEGIHNDGTAHIVEYFYRKKDLWNAYGSPLADILGDISELLRTGEYKDTTGLAQRQEVNIPAEPLCTSNGTIYGYAKDGKIYLTDRGFNPNTPIHEYTHLWVKAMQAKNPQGWQSVVGLLKGTPMWDEVANDPHYSHLTDDNAIASEVLSHYSGTKGAQHFDQKAKEVLEQNPGISAFARARVLLNNVREALNKFWNWVGKDIFHIDHFDSIEEVSDRILYDLANGTNLGADIKDGVAEMQIAPLPKKEGESIADYARRMVDYQNSFAIDQAAQKAQFEYEKHINEQHSALRKLEKGVTDFAKPIMSFQEYMVKQGAVMDIDSDTYQDIWRAGSRTQTAINKYHRECEEPLANTVKSIVNSKKLDNLGFVWQNLPYDNLKKDKDQMNGMAITPRRVIGLYLQAKDCEEALQLGLVDRGAAGFEQNVCLPNVEGYEHGVPHTKIIEMVEDALGKDMVDILWKRVRAAVDYGLDYQVKRGMINDETRNKYRREFYVPQRGWEERDMSGLATDYQRAGGALYGSPYNSALKQAKGRASLAADPFAYITGIAYSSITSADDNVTRQHLLKFCLDNEELGLQSGAFRIKKFWVVREMDADGNVIGEPTISYAQPTERMYEHDKEINAKLNTIRKQLGELNRLESQWQSVVEIENINDIVREAVNKKLQSIQEEKTNLETEAEALNSQLCVLNSRSTDGFNLQLSEDEIGDLTKLDQDTHRTKAELNQHVIYVEHNGQKYALLFKNEQIPNALNKTYKSSLMEIPIISEAARKATRLISATLTQYNPEFAARNYIKDRQTAITTLSIEQGAKFTAKFEANLNSPLLNAAVMQYAFNDNVRDREKVSGKYKELLNEYFEHGAQTGYSFLPDLQRVRQDFDKLLKNNNAKEFGKATVNMLSVLTEASETSIRFAAYVTARESGMSADAAASLSKELTTNFDRHGEWSNSALMSLYSFMRATINGNLKYLRGFKKFPVGFSIAAAAYYAAGVLCSLLNPNDPDNDIWFTDYVRETNITLGKFLGITAKIPLGHFMVMFYAAGVNTVAGVRGNKSAGEAVFDTMQMASNEFLPSWMNFMAGATYDTNTGMGFDATQFAQSAAPSVVSPFVDVWLNRNFMGGRINNEYDWNKDEKDILKYKSGTSQFYIDMANGLYEAVGGDLKVKNKLDDNTIQKLVDVSPSTTEHIVEGYSPAIAETILQTAAVIQSAAQGAEIAADELPFVRKFYSSYRPERAAAQQYYMLKSRSKDYSDLLKEYQKKDPNKYNSERDKGKADLNERTQRALKRINLDSPSNADIKTLMELNREWNKIE